MSILSQRKRDERHRINVHGITIDSETTFDKDDAINIKRLKNGHVLLMVHVADVAHYIKQGSDTDIDAYKQAETLYLPKDNVVHMLRKDLAENKYSLLEGKERRTLTVTMELNEYLDIKNITLDETLLTVDRSYTYEEVSDYVDFGNKSLKSWCALGKALYEKRRRRAGKFTFNEDEHIYYDENGRALHLPEGELKAHMLIAETMIKANEAVAQYCDDNNIPIMARNQHNKIHTSSKSEGNDYIYGVDLDRIEDYLNGTEISAEYGSKFIKHENLGIVRYTHFTCPIRRYPDVTVHRQIKAHLHGEKLPYSVENYNDISRHINTVMRDNKYKIEKNIHRFHVEANKKKLQTKPWRRHFKHDSIEKTHGLLLTSLKENIQNKGFRNSLCDRLASSNISIDLLYTIVHGIPGTDTFWEPLVNSTAHYFKKNPLQAIDLWKHSENQRENWKIEPILHTKDSLYAQQYVLHAGNQQLSNHKVYYIRDKGDAKRRSIAHFWDDYMRHKLVSPENTELCISKRMARQEREKQNLIYGEKADKMLLNILAKHGYELMSNKQVNCSGNYTMEYALIDHDNFIATGKSESENYEEARQTAAFNLINSMKELNLITAIELATMSEAHQEFRQQMQNLGSKKGWPVNDNKCMKRINAP